MSLVIGGEGPSGVVGAANRLVLVGWQIAKRVLLLAILGVPLTHSSFTVAGDGLAVAHLGGTYTGFSPGWRRMVLFPPIML